MMKRTCVDRCWRPLDLILAGNPPFVDVLYFLLDKMDFNCYKRESARVYSITWREVANSSTKHVYITNQHEMRICVSKFILGPQRTKKTGSQLPISGICGKSNGSPQFWPTYPHLSFPIHKPKETTVKSGSFPTDPLTAAELAEAWHFVKAVLFEFATCRNHRYIIWVLSMKGCTMNLVNMSRFWTSIQSDMKSPFFPQYRLYTWMSQEVGKWGW